MNKPDGPRVFSINRYYRIASRIYGVVLLIACILVTVSDYRRTKEDTLIDVRIALNDTRSAYQDLYDNFWQIYMPLYESKGETYDTVNAWFQGPLTSPQQKVALTGAMQLMMVRDNRVRWLLLYSAQRDEAVVLEQGAGSIRSIPADDALLNLARGTQAIAEIIGHYDFVTGDQNIRPSFVIRGGATKLNVGSILVGYDESLFGEIGRDPMNSLNASFFIAEPDRLLYSGPNFDSSLPVFDLEKNGFTRVGSNWVNVQLLKKGRVTFGCIIRPRDLFQRTYRSMIRPMALILVVILLTVSLNRMIVLYIQRRIGEIQSGLARIGEQQLDYRFDVSGRQDEFTQIAGSINQMTEKLQKTVDLAYKYQLKQRNAELSELQSKFNPHFLYNALEALRGQMYENGDYKTAETITKMASIFRGLISPQKFATVAEELAFNQTYTHLFRAHQEKQFTIEYAVETEILEYGIIRNVLQPVLENCFVHGLGDGQPMCITIKGSVLDETRFHITVSDSGRGMEPDAFQALVDHLDDPDEDPSVRSYGLRNVHQRLQLFYGMDCGLHLSLMQPHGFQVEIICRRMTCDDLRRFWQKYSKEDDSAHLDF